ncbi:uracil-DNA glycosylase [Spiribacter halobius]
MDSRRLLYLQRMGIDVWVRRTDAAVPSLRPETAEESERTPESARAGEVSVAQPAPAGEMPASPDETVREPAGTAAEAADWETLRQQVLSCTRCPLHRTRTQGVFGVGSQTARLLIVGEAPGAEEDRRGEPFVGRAGQLLDAMLRAIGLDRQTVYITNILKSRPPENRDPRPEEVAACEPYLRRQIELLAPALIVAVGRVAAQNLLRTDRPLGRLRGQWHRYGPRETPLLATYHPAYLLRNPADKRKAWQDLKAVRRALDTEVSA